MSRATSEADFRALLAARGYDEVRRLGYDAHHRPDLHTHEFDAIGFVVDGELTIVTDDGAATYRTGQTYEVPAGTRHAEHTDAVATTALVGVRHRLP